MYMLPVSRNSMWTLLVQLFSALLSDSVSEHTCAEKLNSSVTFVSSLSVHFGNDSVSEWICRSEKKRFQVFTCLVDTYPVELTVTTLYRSASVSGIL